ALIWAFLHCQIPEIYSLGAAVGAGAFLVWMAALSISLRHQGQRERRVDNTVRDEIERNLSLLDYQLSRYGRAVSAMMWASPVLIGSDLIYWLGVEANLDPGESRWDSVWMLGVVIASVLVLPFSSSRDVRKRLEPRRQRLRDL
ncbi:hypothetical protein LTR94_032830, partial [Friedmanniomyces endolithicus]